MKFWITIAVLVWWIPGRAFGQFQEPRIVVSYNGLTEFGRNNRDSVCEALRRIGVPFDSIDRNLNDSIDYTPWQILVWSSGDPNVPVVAGEANGQAGLSAMEIAEVEQFLQAGTPSCQKKLVMAGENIAHEHGALVPNGADVDTTFLEDWLHVKFVADAPAPGTYQGWILGDQPAYWKFPDSISSASPDVVLPALRTAQVGPIVNQPIYSYYRTKGTQLDSAAGVSYYDVKTNIVFYPFDWADILQTIPGGHGDTTSGTTRVLAGAFAFFRSHQGQSGCPSDAVADPGSRSVGLVELFPNPVSNSLTLRFAERKGVAIHYAIQDVLGNTLESGESAAVTFALSVQALRAGVYEFRAESKGLVQSKRFVVIK